MSEDTQSRAKSGIELSQKESGGKAHVGGRNSLIKLAKSVLRLCHGDGYAYCWSGGKGTGVFQQCP